jgi:pyruvate kinase
MTDISGTERRTKIVCTIGPASAAEAGLRALIERGMNVARLNFSHGEREEHGAVIARVRELGATLDVPVAILQDLAGPKVRIGTVGDGSITLEAGRPFALTTRPVDGSAERVSVSYAGLPGEVRAGDPLLLADGAIELRVERVTADEIHCQVVVGGRLSSRKGVNVPSGLPGLPSLGDKDLADLRFGLERGVDYIGLSFVRTADDVRSARARIEALGGHVPVIAKIETRSALEHAGEIIAAADGIMIARGDLSIETAFTRVPIVQKDLIRQVNRQAKPVITATQMLFSMVSSPRPTRAEVADVANAILDGSDALMLSEETATGEHPARAVEVMAAVARETERAARGPGVDDPAAAGPGSAGEAMARAACQLAAQLAADVIVTITHSGETARLAARYRPAQPILALTPSVETYRRLALVGGVVPVCLPSPVEAAPASYELARTVAREHGWGRRRAVFVARDRLWTGGL